MKAAAPIPVMLASFEQVIDELGLMLVAIQMVDEALVILTGEYPNVDEDLLDDVLWWRAELARGGIESSDLRHAVDLAHSVKVGAR